MSVVAPAPSRPDYHEAFAAVYDTFYRRRDVDTEVALALDLLKLDREVVAGAPVLDFGCGTGSHVLALAGRGVPAIGFDVSEAMIHRARGKLTDALSSRATFAAGDFESFCGELEGRGFAGAVSFFNVLNCVPEPSVLVRQLELIRESLLPGGCLLADVWNGVAVFADEPRPDVRHYPDEHDPQSEVIRITIPELDRVRQRCVLRYRVLSLDRACGRFSEFESVHDLRFLTPAQYRHVFELAGLVVREEFPKGHPGVPVTADDWYISYLVERAEA